MKYEKIYVIESSQHDLSALKEHTGDIRYLVSAYDDPSTWIAKITENIKEFDPKTDAIVPVGKLIPTLIVGMALQGHAVTVGVFHDKEYHFMQIDLGGSDAPN
jgi:hypothetical protein